MRYALILACLCLFAVPDAQANCGGRGLFRRQPIRSLWQRIRPHRQQAVQCLQQCEPVKPKEEPKDEPKKDDKDKKHHDEKAE
jgi:hypothetical protein